jgi:hypothetical protein
MEAKATYHGCNFYEKAIVRDVVVKVEFGKQTVKKLRAFLKQNPDAEEIRIGYIMDFTIDQTKGSWAYGDECQFKTWRKNPDPKIELRVQDQNGYDRTETNMSVTEGLSFLYDSLKSFQGPHENVKLDSRKPRGAMEKVADFV